MNATAHSHSKAEVTLRAWIDAPWFRGTARLFMIVGPVVLTLGGSVIGWMVFDTRNLAMSAQTTAADVQTTLGKRIDKNDDFQAQIQGQVTAIDSRTIGMQATLNAVQIDAAKTRGILEQMERQATVAYHVPGVGSPTGWSDPN